MKRALLSLALLAAACGQTQTPQAHTTLTVFAAASLANAFQAVATGFAASHPDTTVRFNFAGSPTLVTQLDQGAKADVLATADVTNMTTAQRHGLVKGDPRIFAHNQLEIAVAPGNPKHILTLQDLSRPGLTVVLAGPQVPAGKYAAQVLSKAASTVQPKSLETDVESVLTKVELGEADAGIVYTTDVKAAGSRVEGIPIPIAQNVVAAYPVAALSTAGSAFVTYLTSPAGAEVLQRYGFQAG